MPDNLLDPLATVAASAFRKTIDEMLAAIEVQARDGLTISEASKIFHDFLARAIEEAKQLAADGAKKKSLVLDAAGLAFDVVAPLVPVPFWWRPFQSLARPLLRTLFLRVADGSVETIYRLTTG